jgi:two-component system, LytTR family, response regulator
MLTVRESVAPRLQPQARVRTLIVDDESLSRERVRSLLERSAHVEVVGECANGLEALQAIEAEEPDLVFLDVEMPELSGLAVLEAIEPERCPEVVFVTAHDKYLQRAFEVHALDYLRKPFTDERFYDALRHASRRVQERLSRAATHDAVLALMAELRERATQIRDRLVVQDKERGIFHVVRSHDVDWLEAKNGGVILHVGKQARPVRQTLAEVESRLDPSMFLRIHRSLIVNRARIVAVEHLWKGEYRITLSSGKSVCTGRTYRGAIESFLECA